MGDIRLGLVAESFKDLYRIYKPKDLNKFTRDFMKKYKIPKYYETFLKNLVKEKQNLT